MTRTCTTSPRHGRYSAPFRIIHNLAANNRHEILRGENLGLGLSHDVTREDGEIGEFARRDRSFVVLLERCERGPRRERLECLVARHGFFGVPTDERLTRGA